MSLQYMGKVLIYLGVALAVAGLLLHFGGKWVSLGRLPGDFKWESGNFSIYFPLASSILVSVVLTVLFNWFWRR